MWWIAAGVAVVAVVVLVAALMSLAGHVRPLKRAMRRLRWRSEEAQQLQVKVAALQERLEGVRAEAERAAARAEELKTSGAEQLRAARAGLHDGG